MTRWFALTMANLREPVRARQRTKATPAWLSFEFVECFDLCAASSPGVTRLSVPLASAHVSMSVLQRNSINYSSSDRYVAMS